MSLIAIIVALGASSSVYGAVPPPAGMRCADIARFEHQFAAPSSGSKLAPSSQRMFRRRLHDRDADVFYRCDGDELDSQAYLFDGVPYSALASEIDHHKRMLMAEFGPPCLDWDRLGEAKRKTLLAEDVELQRHARFSSYWSLKSGGFLVLTLTELSGAPRVIIEFKRQFDLGRNSDGTRVLMPNPCDQAQ